MLKRKKLCFSEKIKKGCHLFLPLKNFKINLGKKTII
jgi:hypothetical protein